MRWTGATQLYHQPMSGRLLGTLQGRQLPQLPAAAESLSPRLPGFLPLVGRRYFEGVLSLSLYKAPTMSSFDLEHYQRQAGTQCCSAETCLAAGPGTCLAAGGTFGVLGLFYALMGLGAALACHAHPSDFVQPCEDTLNGPWLPAAIIQLLSLIHIFALGLSRCRYRMTS